MRAIPLTRGKETVVDDDDYEFLIRTKWSAGIWEDGPRPIRNSKTLNGKRHQIFMHREIWEHHYGSIPKGMEIDHINGDRLDNQLHNLRLCTRSQNMANQRKKAPHSSIFKGVCYYKRDERWQAYIQQDGRQYHIGYFDSEVGAAKAYDIEARKRFGEFAALNLNTGGI